VLLPLKKLRLLLLLCPPISSLHPIGVPHLLTAKGFLKDQIVLILFKVSMKQIPNFSIIVLFPLKEFWNFALKFHFTVTLAHFCAGEVPILFFLISGT